MPWIQNSAHAVVEKYYNHLKKRDRHDLKLEILQSLIEEALNDAATSILGPDLE